MTTVRMRKVGGSVMVAIPPAILASAGLAPESEVDVSVDPATGTVSLRATRRRYSLDALLAQYDPDVPETEENRTWLDDGPVGREAI